MSQSSGPERDFEKLSKAITEAVMMSPKVRKIVTDIQKKDEVCAQSFMVLVLRLSTLTESLETEVSMDPPEEKPKKKPSRRGRKKAGGNTQYIDGQKLTKNEMQFEEFVNQDFDEDDWLRQNKLIL